MRLKTLLFAVSLGYCTLPASAQYAYFSRPTDTIEIHGNTVLTTTATIEARVYLTAASAGNVLAETGGISESKLLQVGATTLFGIAKGTSGSAAWNFSISLSLRRWYHIAYVYTGTQDRLFLDGSLVASRTRTAAISNASGYFSLGSHGNGSPSFIGYLDTVRVSDSVRYTDTFVPPTGDLPTDAHTKLLYNFNEPLGSTAVTDLSGSGNNGEFGTGFTGATSPTIAASVGTVSIGGTVALQGTQTPAQALTFTFHPSAGSEFTLTAALDNSGGYSFSGVPDGLYTVSIKGAKWLRRNIVVDARNGSVTNANANLLSGDANDDNVCDIADLLLLIAHYNQVSPNAGFLDAADLNCDGVDDIADLLLLVANYNKQGDS